MSENWDNKMKHMQSKLWLSKSENSFIDCWSTEDSLCDNLHFVNDRFDHVMIPITMDDVSVIFFRKKWFVSSGPRRQECQNDNIFHYSHRCKSSTKVSISIFLCKIEFSDRITLNDVDTFDYHLNSQEIKKLLIVMSPLILGRMKHSKEKQIPSDIFGENRNRFITDRYSKMCEQFHLEIKITHDTLFQRNNLKLIVALTFTSGGYLCSKFDANKSIYIFHFSIDILHLHNFIIEYMYSYRWWLYVRFHLDLKTSYWLVTETPMRIWSFINFEIHAWASHLPPFLLRPDIPRPFPLLHFAVLWAAHRPRQPEHHATQLAQLREGE